MRYGKLEIKSVVVFGYSSEYFIFNVKYVKNIGVGFLRLKILFKNNKIYI